MPRLRYHHLGIPTDRELPEEDHIAALKIYASGFMDSPYGVEWVKFDPDCPTHELVKTVPHVAFVVDDLEAALAGQEVLVPPSSPSPGVTVAFIVHNGAPVELLQFDGPESQVWPSVALYRSE